MRAIVMSDIHGNIDVLRALEERWGQRLEQFDRVVCLGDLVDYGPDPNVVIEWVRARATDVVCGNHDYAMATGEPCQSAPAYLEASIATRDRLRPTLASEHIEYLRQLPRTHSLPVGKQQWRLVHATPRDPLFDYAPPDMAEERWAAALDGSVGGTVIVGHTHLPFVRAIGGGLVVNPGSIGMPKDGHPHGSYVLIEDGAVEFRRIAYDPRPMVGRLRSLDLPDRVLRQLVETFTTGN
jgi:putative phosphoesterase